MKVLYFLLFFLTMAVLVFFSDLFLKLADNGHIVIAVTGFAANGLLCLFFLIRLILHYLNYRR